MDINQVVTANENFQSSVNIAFDLGHSEKIRNLIPTETVLDCLENLLSDVINASSRRAKVMTGPYGKGKSHIVLAALSAMYYKNPEIFGNISKAYSNSRPGFTSSFKEFVSSGRRLLPVIISGSSSDLRHSLLGALKNALRGIDAVGLMPKTNFAGAIEAITLWSEKYPDTLTKFESSIGLSYEETISRLEGFDTEIYEEFVGLYPQMTSGSHFNDLENADVVSVYQNVADKLKAMGFSGIYVVYDEFSKYLEANIANTTIEDIKLLQDFAECCNRSTIDSQLHLLLIGHKSLSNYIDSKLPKEKVDGWRGVSGRFFEIEVWGSSSQSYELISNAIVKDSRLWSKWLEIPGNRAMLEEVEYKYVKKGIIPTGCDDTVVFGCYPRHPLSTFLLPRLSEKVAQNERTLFTFVSSRDEKSLTGILAKSNICTFVSPDYIYDYFEPLFRREYYTSPIRKTYELAARTLAKIPQDSLQSKLVKLLASIYIVAEFDRVEPTKQTLLDVYIDCGYTSAEIEEAINGLVEDQSLIYLRRSNAFLKLKESSGEDIESVISDRAERIKTSSSPTAILNEYLSGRAIYPSRHNNENAITRYFDYSFIREKDLDRLIRTGGTIPSSGDGVVAAIYPENPDSIDSIVNAAKAYTGNDPLAVLTVPKAYKTIDQALYRFIAASQLMNEESDDEVLRDEYELVLEDCEEQISTYISAAFRPELKSSAFISNGMICNVNRRAKLSELLSQMCDATYPYTPYINNETLNKNVLTGAAKHSRSKILLALTSQNLEPNLGFIGSGQEISMMRSILKMTGLVESIDSNPTVNLHPESKNINHAISTIEDAIFDKGKICIGAIYSMLTGRSRGIGMKRGPIAVFLALVFREHKNELQIVAHGEEKPLSGDLLDDIDADPDSYVAQVIDWNAAREGYLKKLADIFECRTFGRAQIVESIEKWYVNLPQVVRTTRKYRGYEGITKKAYENHQAFLRTLQRHKPDTQVFLFEELPLSFGLTAEDSDLLILIKQEKDFCEKYVAVLKEALANELKGKLEPSAPAVASLQSVCLDWSESHPNHLGSGVNALIARAISSASGDEQATISRIAKACTSLRVEDWNDGRIDDFYSGIDEFIQQSKMDNGSQDGSDNSNEYVVKFVDENMNMLERSFKRVECGPRARLLKNELLNSIDEMGNSISDAEKKQVVMDVLRSML